MPLVRQEKMRLDYQALCLQPTQDPNGKLGAVMQAAFPTTPRASLTGSSAGAA